MQLERKKKKISFVYRCFANKKETKQREEKEDEKGGDRDNQTAKNGIVACGDIFSYLFVSEMCIMKKRKVLKSDHVHLEDNGVIK